MSRKYFGTDGIRGTANEGFMTPDLALRVGQAAGHYFKRKSHHPKPTVLIGKDVRLSGYMFEYALVAGFTSVGFNCLLVGPMPTPAVAYLTRSMRADLGVMISASHNPFQDNGIKLFGPDGFKLSDANETELEALIDDMPPVLAAPDQIGKAVRIDDASGRYMEFCKNSVDGNLDLTGMRIVVDAANGATYKVASKLFWELGAQVIRLGTEPDGFNINRECGALHPENMASHIKSHGADIGIALDGDGDRLIICDEKGQVIDGDQIMAAVGSYMHKHGLLKGGGVVATQMSNMGLEKHLNDNGLELVRTQVGDRYVMEAMRRDGYNFGGEASSHLILSDYATTGDGLLAALKFLEVMKTEGARASVLGSTFKAYPQKMNNIRLSNFDAAAELMNSDKTKSAVEAAEKELAGKGRVLVRKSGTEPLVRVMVEAEDMALVDGKLGQLTEQIQE